MFLKSNKMGKKPKNNERRKKVALVFDEEKRKDFLCGFRKRKLERKKKAQEEIKELLKAEKKRIKQENKESYKKLVVSSRPIPDIEQLLQEEYEDDDVNVKIVELSTDTLKKKNLCLGDNRPEIKEESKVEKVKNESVIPGMGMDEESEKEENEDSEREEKAEKTKKEIKRMLKHQATKKLQKSKVFQMKSKLDRIQNKKKSQSKAAHGKVKKHGKDKTKKGFSKRKH